MKNVLNQSFKNLISWEDGINFWGAVFRLFQISIKKCFELISINRHLQKFQLTFSSLIKFLKPWYFLRRRYKSFIICVFSCSICEVVIGSNRSKRSFFSAASSESFWGVFTSDFCVFSMIEHALITKAGTVSFCSCFGISTKVQYSVSSFTTSYRGERLKDVNEYQEMETR